METAVELHHRAPQNERVFDGRPWRWVPVAIAIALASCDGSCCTADLNFKGCGGDVLEGGLCAYDNDCYTGLRCCSDVCEYECSSGDPCIDYGDCPDAIPQVAATVTVAVEGYGRVRDTNGLIDCDADQECAATVLTGDTISLLPEPYLGGTVAWSGLPAGATTFTVTSSIRVTATFTGALGRWPVRIGGTGDDNGFGVVVHPSGFIVAVGTIVGQVTVGSDVLTSNGQSDVAIVALGPDGTVLWARSVGGAGYDIVAGVAVDPISANIIVAGECSGPTNFGDGVTRCTAGSFDGFLLALQPDAALAWVRTFGGPGAEWVGGLAVADDGGIGIVGSNTSPFSIDTVDFNSQPGLFVAALDNSGSARWGQSFPSGNSSAATAIVPDGTGFVIGGAFDQIDLGSGLQTADGYTDAFVLALADGGTVSWSRVISGTGEDDVGSLDRLPNGTIGVLGSYHFALDLGGGPIGWWGQSDLFLAELDANGNHLWSTHIGGPGHDIPAGLCADGAGGWYVADRFEDALWWLNPVTEHLGPGEQDIGWVHLGADRAIDRFGIYGGPTFDAPADITCDDQSTVLTGSVTGTVQFDGLTSPGTPDSDWFIARVPR